MVFTAIQYVKKHYSHREAPIRLKNTIAAPYEGLKKMKEKLQNINRDTYTTQLANGADGCGDCCSLRIIEWGHSRKCIEEDVSHFIDEDHMEAVGEYYISVNETVLLADDIVFNIAEGDEDSHRPLIVHCDPFDQTYAEVNSYKDPETKERKAQNGRERQAQNRQKGRPSEAKEEPKEIPSDDGEWGQYEDDLKVDRTTITMVPHHCPMRLEPVESLMARAEARDGSSKYMLLRREGSTSERLSFFLVQLPSVAACFHILFHQRYMLCRRKGNISDA